MAAVICREHVRITVKDGHAADVIGFDEIGNFGPFIAVDGPMVFIGRRARAPATGRGKYEVRVMNETELVGADTAIVISVSLPEPRHRADPKDERISILRGKE